MATSTTLISSVTVGSGGAANIDFSSISSSYTDLMIQCSIKEATTNNFTVSFRINNSSSAIYSEKTLQGDGSNASSGGSSGQTSIAFLADPATYSGTTNVFGSAELYFPNYAGSNNKSISIDSSQEINGSLGYNRFTAGLWASTAAINQITIFASGGNIAQYSTAYLYGIKNS